MMPLTVLGSHGFVGGTFWDRHCSIWLDKNRPSIRNARDDYRIQSPDVLYFISTVHNYNIFESSHIDIDTNLTTLMTVLDNWHDFIKKEERKTGAVSKGVFNFISSWFVYGETPDPHNVNESAPCQPKGFYSITKRCAEQLLKSYCDTFGLNYRILRLANVVGSGDKKISKQKNALQYMINQLKANEPIEIYDDGKFYRDYIHVQDCADAIDLVITKGNINDIYNVGNGKTWEFKDILYYARRMLNSDSTIGFTEPKEFHQSVQIKSFYMDNSKLVSLGYKPNYLNENLYKSLL